MNQPALAFGGRGQDATEPPGHSGALLNPPKGGPKHTGERKEEMGHNSGPKTEKLSQAKRRETSFLREGTPRLAEPQRTSSQPGSLQGRGEDSRNREDKEARQACPTQPSPAQPQKHFFPKSLRKGLDCSEENILKIEVKTNNTTR